MLKKKNIISGKKINKKSSLSKITSTKKRKSLKKNIVKEPIVEYVVKFISPAKRVIDESWDFRKSHTKEYL